MQSGGGFVQTHQPPQLQACMYFHKVSIFCIYQGIHVWYCAHKSVCEYFMYLHEVLICTYRYMHMYIYRYMCIYLYLFVIEWTWVAFLRILQVVYSHQVYHSV